jgi:hypothetical protein
MFEALCLGLVEIALLSLQAPSFALDSYSQQFTTREDFVTSGQ